MIAISYIYYCSVFKIKLKVFSKEDEAKQWFIDEMENIGILTNWYDDDNDIYLYDIIDIKKCIKTLPLIEIINGIMSGGDIDIKMEEFTVK